MPLLHRRSWAERSDATQFVLQESQVVQDIVEQLALIGLLALLVKLTLWAQPDAAEPVDAWDQQVLPAAPVLLARTDEAA